MKRILLLIAGCWLLIAGKAIGQTDTTSYFEIKLYNTANKLVSGKDVDLYQGVTKKYDLTESSSVPGVYSATVRHGEYDIYVNTSLWKSGIWIGANKVSHVVDLFRFTAGPDTMEMTGHVKATSFEGDGTLITGISGSVSESVGDLILGADSDTTGSGDIHFRIAKYARAKLLNNGVFTIGYQGTSITGSLVTASSISTADDSADGSLAALSVGSGTSNVVAGQVGAGSFLPLAFWTKGIKRAYFDTTGILNSGYVASLNPIELSGAAWFGATADTSDGIIPCVSFRHTGEDTAWYDAGIFAQAVQIDSIWLEITPELTTGDSARFVLGQRQVDIGSTYYGAFNTQNSTYTDLGATVDQRIYVSCTTAIALSPGFRLILRVYRDNAISDNSQGKVKMISAILYGKGLR